MIVGTPECSTTMRNVVRPAAIVCSTADRLRAPGFRPPARFLRRALPTRLPRLAATDFVAELRRAAANRERVSSKMTGEQAVTAWRCFLRMRKAAKSSSSSWLMALISDEMPREEVRTPSKCCVGVRSSCCGGACGGTFAQREPCLFRGRRATRGKYQTKKTRQAPSRNPCLFRNSGIIASG